MSRELGKKRGKKKEGIYRGKKKKESEAWRKRQKKSNKSWIPEWGEVSVHVKERRSSRMGPPNLDLGDG